MATSTSLGGEVELDESFIGAKTRNMHKDKRTIKITGTGPEGKAIIAAVLERGGKVRAKVMSTRTNKDLHNLMRDNVEAGASLYTDALKSYDGLDEVTHQVIDHAEAYVSLFVYIPKQMKWLHADVGAAHPTLRETAKLLGRVSVDSPIIPIGFR